VKEKCMLLEKIVSTLLSTFYAEFFEEYSEMAIVRQKIKCFCYSQPPICVDLHFLATSVIKTKYRNRLNAEADIRL
jgi:hypothetical protein